MLLKQGTQILLIYFPEVVQKTACTPPFIITNYKIQPKVYFLSKTGRMNIIEFNTFELFKAPSFILIGQFCLFNLVPKNFRLPLIAKNELGTRLRQFYFFFAKFAQKVYSRSKTGQMNITIVFNISELVDVTSFILNRQF